MPKESKQQYKQFAINTIEDGMLVLKSLIVPVITDLEKFNDYAKEAESLLDQYKPDNSIPARVYDSLHDKLLYQQRELLRFIADHQSSSFSYIAVRTLLVKKGFLKREIDESNRIILNELLDIRNWSFHNAQSMTVADLEIAKKTVPAPLAESIEIKPMLNPIVVRRVKTYSWKMLADFVVHNTVRSSQFEKMLTEMKADYQEMYDQLPETTFMMVSCGTGLTREIQYIEQEVFMQNPEKAGRAIASLSMGIQKGKYDGTNEAFQQWTGKKSE